MAVATDVPAADRAKVEALDAVGLTVDGGDGAAFRLRVTVE